jgi:hypothetical protein
VAELISGEIARTLGLPVPEQVFAELDVELARTEPDPEIHALLHDSAGLNLALDYLPGSVTFDPITHRAGEDLASRIVWFDAYVTNVDRTIRNTNMLMWHRRLWLIDHGATLYFHHTPGWESDVERARAPFALISNHVLLPDARRLTAVDEEMAMTLSRDRISEIIDVVPTQWLAGEGRCDAGAVRAAYVRYLVDRAAAPRTFVEVAAGGR